MTVVAPIRTPSGPDRDSMSICANRPSAKNQDRHVQRQDQQSQQNASTTQSEGQRSTDASQQRKRWRTERQG
jgi:hypothetical protein